MNPSEGVREIEKENLKRLLHKLCNLMDGENTWEEVDEKGIAILSESLTQAEKRGFERAREEALNIANMIPLDENFIPAGNYSANGMNGLVRVIRKGIVENIRNLTYEKKGTKNAKTN